MQVTRAEKEADVTNGITRGSQRSKPWKVDDKSKLPETGTLSNSVHYEKKTKLGSLSCQTKECDLENL